MDTQKDSLQDKLFKGDHFTTVNNNVIKQPLGSKDEEHMCISGILLNRYNSESYNQVRTLKKEGKTKFDINKCRPLTNIP